MWSHKFDFSNRHCYPLIDGTYAINGSMDVLCPNPQEHPLKTGNTEFIRWIREFGQLVEGVVTGYRDGWLKLGQEPMETAPYYMISCYCENYGGRVKAFLNPKEGWAIVEIPDEYSNLWGYADIAVDKMRLSYVQ